MLTRMTIILTQEERDALIRLASAEMRGAREHIRWLVVLEARKQGLLNDNYKNSKDEHLAENVGVPTYAAMRS